MLTLSLCVILHNHLRKQEPLVKPGKKRLSSFSLSVFFSVFQTHKDTLASGHLFPLRYKTWVMFGGDSAQ